MYQNKKQQELVGLDLPEKGKKVYIDKTLKIISGKNSVKKDGQVLGVDYESWRTIETPWLSLQHCKGNYEEKKSWLCR